MMGDLVIYKLSPSPSFIRMETVCMTALFSGGYRIFERGFWSLNFYIASYDVVIAY